MRYNKKTSRTGIQWFLLFCLGVCFCIAAVFIDALASRIISLGIGVISMTVSLLSIWQITRFQFVELSESEIVIGLTSGKMVFKMPSDLVRVYRIDESKFGVILELSNSNGRYRFDSELIAEQEAFTKSIVMLFPKTGHAKDAD